jgi:Arc/MetJ-type ribon-helix-helix transcriptional regulator
MDIFLDEELERIVEEQLKTGLYEDAHDVIYQAVLNLSNVDYKESFLTNNP